MKRAFAMFVVRSPAHEKGTDKLTARDNKSVS
jgi:hypothetical protein